jgi:hypothetical protein
MMRFDMLFSEVIGWDRMALSLGIERARVMVVRNRASSGTESRVLCRNAVPQFGRFGCKRAHDRFEIAGCAGPVIGEIDDTDEGRVLGSPGCRIGETNALYHISNFNTLPEPT